MNRKELIESLLQHELNQFRFSIWARFNEEDKLEYEFCLKGAKPTGYDIHILDIGGIPDCDYTSDLLDNKMKL